MYLRCGVSSLFVSRSFCLLTADELDSYMYQTVGHQAIEMLAKAMALPLYRRYIKGGSLNQSRDYDVTQDDEVEDLYHLLNSIKVRSVIF